jgi:hypothetical protein
VVNSPQRLSFDTSGVNALADSPAWAALLAGIRCGYFTRLTFPSIAEPLATTDPVRRNRLFDVLNALRLNGECLQPHNVILTQLVQNHANNNGVRWSALDLNFNDCEMAIARRDFSEKESEDERKFAVETEERFTSTFADVRPRFETVFKDGTERPLNADELLTHLNGEGGAHWMMAANLYERAAGVRPTEEQISAFVQDCPPFFALMLGLVHAQFEWSITGAPVKKKKRVGKTDLFSAIYLPYCDLYITDDDEQRRCMTEIAVAAKLPVEILSFRDFSDRLMPLALSASVKSGMKRKAKKRKPTVEELRKMPLTETQWQCPSNFYEAAWESFSHTFRDAVRVHRGPHGFRGEKNAAACKQQCLDEFNRGRDEMIDVARDLTDQSDIAEKIRAKLPSLKKSTE